MAVHAAPAASHDLRLDALRLAPLPPLRATALRQKIGFRPAAQIAVVRLPECLRAGAVMAVEIADPANATDRPAFTASYSGSKLVNMHSNDDRGRAQYALEPAAVG
jgi:hypothetical protein